MLIYACMNMHKIILITFLIQFSPYENSRPCYLSFSQCSNYNWTELRSYYDSLRRAQFNLAA